MIQPEKPKIEDVLLGEIRAIRREIGELSLEIRGDSWGFRIRSNLSEVNKGLQTIPRISKVFVVMGFVSLSICIFIKDKELKQKLAAVAVNILITGFLMAGGI